jgi:large subunit ribosomal protein L32
MPNPRRKISRSKRDMRRAAWARKLQFNNLIDCENCGEKKMPHHACPNCGTYRGKAVITPGSEA